MTTDDIPLAPHLEINRSATLFLSPLPLPSLLEHVAAECVPDFARREAKMKWPLPMLLALAVAGCADRSNVDQEPSITLLAPAGHILSLPKSVSRKSMATGAEASRTHASENTYKSSLMECVSEACKIQCSPALENQSRPKWCMYFKVPIDRHAEIHGKSGE